MQFQAQQNHLPENLPQLAKLFALSYRADTGGYLVPPRTEMGVFDDKDVKRWAEIYKDRPQYDSVELEVSLFLHGLIRMTGARRVLETGCSRGFSTSFLASAVEQNGGGQVVTVDLVTQFHLWQGSELEKSITFIEGSSTSMLPQVVEVSGGEKFDLLFLDSLHTYSHLLQEIMIYEQLLKVGGVIVLHDTLYYDCLAPVVLAVAANQRFDVVTLPTPRKHEIGTRPPGVTLITKNSDDKEKSPLLLSQKYIHWVKSVVGNRSVHDKPMLDVMRREGLL